MVFTAKEIHHVIKDDSGMCVDVAEGVIVEEVGGNFGPYFGSYVVAIYGALLGKVIFWLLSQNAAVYIKGRFVDDCRVILALNGFL